MSLIVKRSMKPNLFFLSDDQRILDLMREGDEEALATLFQQNKRVITSFVMRNNGSEEDAEDVLQDSVIIVWERVRTGRYEHSAKLSTFLFAVAKNVWSRKRMRKLREPAGEFDNNTLMDAALSPLEEMIDSEQSKAIADALDVLGEPCKSLLLLFYRDELSQDEIAVELGFANAATVKSKKYTCIKMLEKIWKGSGLHE